ncbi:MAG: S9 family peptidase, partial [Verrucomicrobiota bacterium]
MKRFALSSLVLFTPIFMPAQTSSPWNYPDAKRLDLVEKIHGVDVPDPYRWLEDVDSDKTKAWIAAQNELSDAYFDEAPGRDWIEERLSQLWAYDKYGLPRKVAGRLFYTKKTGLQNHSVLYWREDEPDAKPKLLLDPNTFSEDGTVALSSWRVSDDGEWLAYGISEGGSDWMEWKVREVDSGKDLSDHLKWIKFSGASWARDSSGFYYSRYPETTDDEELEAVNLNQKVYFHKLGDPQEKDRLVYERPDEPKWGFGCWETEDSQYLLFRIWASSGQNNAFFYKDLANNDKIMSEAPSWVGEPLRVITHSDLTAYDDDVLDVF